MITLTGNEETIRLIKDGASADKIIAGWTSQLTLFAGTRARYLLYK